MHFTLHTVLTRLPGVDHGQKCKGQWATIDKRLQVASSSCIGVWLHTTKTQSDGVR